MFIINSLKSNRLILGVALLLTLCYNWAFFWHVNQVYPAFGGQLGFFVSLGILVFAVMALILSLLCVARATKPVLIIFVVSAAFAAYYMDTFDVIIDKLMIQNVVQTSVKEAGDLFTGKLVLYGVGLGFLPALVLYRMRLPVLSWRQGLVQRLVLILALLVVVASQAVIFSQNYASFFREQKTMRYYINPLKPIYSAFTFASGLIERAPTQVEALGRDAVIPATDVDRELIILVLGETARWDRFSLNGYSKPTNPLLATEKVVSFSNFASCGTSTAVSVPCMFSPFGRDTFSDKKFKSSENVLDVLAHAGVTVLWRDNNSDSKGVAVRLNNVTYQDYKTAPTNTVCDIECRDEGMLVGLQEFINQHPTGDITIILHQMGSHGPAYYKRYPAAFEQFKPACQNNLLEKCSVEEISNAYDNTILYTDYFLSKVIAFLKGNTPKFETAMFYVSDHGESLGEKGVFLHGMPYAIAPESQTHVGAIMWLSDNFMSDNLKGVSFEALKAKEHVPYTHDNLFHTLLGMMEIESKDYDPKLDILKLH
jgi:lipid A ethanolaminephosphotransferase